MAVVKNLRITIIFFFIKSNVFQLSHRIKKKLSKQVHTGEKVLCSCYSRRFVSRFFSDGIKRLVVYFGLYESSLDFQKR